MKPQNDLTADAAARERVGDLAAAHDLFLKVLARAPDNVVAARGAGRTAARVGKVPQTAQVLKGALAKAARSPKQLNATALGLMEMDELDAAAEVAERWTRLAPKDATPFNLLGVILKRAKRYDAAVERFKTAGRLDRKLHNPWVNLGNLYLDQGKSEEAVPHLRKALELNPQDMEALRQLGNALGNLGDKVEGLALIERAMRLAPRDARVYSDRARILFDIGRHEDAMRDTNRAIEIEPRSKLYRMNKAIIEQRMGRLDTARKLFAELVKEDPDDARLLSRFGKMLAKRVGDMKAANDLLERAHALAPDDVMIAAEFCDSLMDSRYDDEAAHIDHAQEIAEVLVDTKTIPLDATMELQRVFLRTFNHARLGKMGDAAAMQEFWATTDRVGALHNQLGRVITMQDRTDLLKYHRMWGDKLESRIDPVKLPAPKGLLAGRKLRIGLMSSDLRSHPVTYFVLPIIEMHDKDQTEVICYSFNPRPADKTQEFISKKVEAFRLIIDQSNAEIARTIADDGLDVLIELGGTTKFNRIEVMAYRPAPLTMSWLGYPHSAGLSRIGHLLVDPYLKPDQPGLICEEPFEMPESWVCLGRSGFYDVPIDLGTPADRNGHITFGTMNNPYKYTPELLRMWGRIMQRAPGSHFLFVRPEGGSRFFRRYILEAFAAEGVDESRVEFLGVRGTHLQHYNKIDISLDTAPHTGGTTTCETLWMGCPVISLAGPAFFERLSYSNLVNAGLGDLVAFTPDEYVEKAVALAGDSMRLGDLRAGLRDQIRAMPLGDCPRWVRNFESALRDLVLRAAPGLGQAAAQ